MPAEIAALTQRLQENIARVVVGQEELIRLMLAAILALASSFLDRPLGADLAAIGEVGLSGELRSVSALNQRLSEIARLGFQRCIIPAHTRDEVRCPAGLQLIQAKNIGEAVGAVLGRK